ncbi:hypothetical protein, partial [Burkholderia sp. SIMBA_062]
KVAHKNEKIKASKNQYFSPFKINCDFLKPFSTSAVEKKEPLISESSSSDSLFAPSATKVGKINKKLFSAQLDNMHYENKGLVNSGYIGEIGNKDN